MLKKLPKKADHPRGGGHRGGVRPRVELLRRGGAPGGNDGPHPPARRRRGGAGAGPRVPEARHPDVHGHEGGFPAEERRPASAWCWRTRRARRRRVEADQILVAIGRTINTDGIGLEKVGSSTEKGFIPVGDYNQTKVPGIYADRRRRRTLRSSRTWRSRRRRSRRSTWRARPPHPRLDPLSIPSATYCEPQVASFGLPEWKAKEKGIAFAKASFPYRGAGKSVAVDQSEGFVKVDLRSEDQGDPRRAHRRRGCNGAHPRAAPGAHRGAAPGGHRRR